MFWLSARTYDLCTARLSDKKKKSYREIKKNKKVGEDKENMKKQEKKKQTAEGEDLRASRIAQLNIKNQMCNEIKRKKGLNPGD